MYKEEEEECPQSTSLCDTENGLSSQTKKYILFEKADSNKIWFFIPFDVKVSLHTRGGQMVKSFNITSKITYFWPKSYNESHKIGLWVQ